MAGTASSPAFRSARLGLRATPRAGIRAATGGGSGTQVPDRFHPGQRSVWPPSKHCWINVCSWRTGKQYQALMDLLERPEQTNEGLRELFSRKAPWEAK